MHQQQKPKTLTREVSPRSKNYKNYFYCMIKTAASKSLNILIRDDLAAFKTETLNLNPRKQNHAPTTKIKNLYARSISKE